MELSDRVGVIYRGEIVALVDGPTAEREEIGLLMATGPPRPGRLAEATTSMTADLQLAETGAPAPTISAEEPPTQEPPPRRRRRRRREHADVKRARKIYALTIIPIISILLALLVGAILIILSSPASQDSSTFCSRSRPTRPCLKAPRGFPSSTWTAHGIAGHLARPQHPGPHQYPGCGRSAGPHGSGRWRRLQGGPVQHRRNRAGARRRFFAALVGGAVADQPVPIAVTRRARRGARRGAVRVHPRRASAPSPAPTRSS